MPLGPERTSIGGFTLVELLVAMAIVAVIGAIALTGLSTVLQQQAIAEERSQRWRDIQFAMHIIAQDLAQVHPRAARDESGETWKPSFLIGVTEQFAVELSRGGWANPAGLPRGHVLRVAYDWEESGNTLLVRFHWPAIDRTLTTPPVRTELLTGVEEMQIRLLDRKRAMARGVAAPGHARAGFPGHAAPAGGVQPHSERLRPPVAKCGRWADEASS